MKIKTVGQDVIASMRETFRYEPETGHVIRIKPEDPRRSNRVGKPAGHINKNDGYMQMLHKGKSYLVHRVVFALMTGEWPTASVDHINRNRADNRWSNLRLCNHTESSTNISVSRRNKTGVRGVQYWPQRDRWVAMIHAHGKKHWLGSFETKEQAIVARIEGGRRIHGEFAGQIFKEPTP